MLCNDEVRFGCLSKCYGVPAYFESREWLLCQGGIILIYENCKGVVVWVNSPNGCAYQEMQTLKLWASRNSHEAACNKGSQEMLAEVPYQGGSVQCDLPWISLISFWTTEHSLAAAFQVPVWIIRKSTIAEGSPFCI